MTTPYDHTMIDSDLDAFKNSGVVKTGSITFAGSIGAGAEMSLNAAVFSVTDLDFSEIMFDNSVQHSGKFKSMRLVPFSMVHESTRDSYLGIDLRVIVVGDTITLGGSLFNPYDAPVSLDSTTINFRYIPYEATL
jgi:hypothetical protein